MAVLYRTNAHSRSFEEAFRMRGVPYRLVGAVSFYERREVKDLLAYLRLIANPADDQAFARIVNVPRRGVGEASLTVLAGTARRWGKPLLEAARAADRIEGLRPGLRDVLRNFASLIDRLRGAAGTSDPATALEAAIATTGYESWLAEEGVEGVERLENVRELVAGAAAWAEVADATGVEGVESEEGGTLIERYLTQSALVTPTDEFGGAGASGVTLLTVHMAKGLEWPVVALAGLEDGLFPLSRTAGEPGGLEEERRLCYVGLTARASDCISPGHAPAIATAAWSSPNGPVSRRRAAAGDRGAQHDAGMEPGRARFGGARSHPPAGGARWELPGRRKWIVEEPEPLFDADESQDTPRYVKGDRVRHRKFGGGVVRDVSGVGRQFKVTVEFDDAGIGTKQLLVAYAALERDWDGESP
jgi:DNA helicase-2/ATP-dependent DNA helicase PcrA